MKDYWIARILGHFGIAIGAGFVVFCLTAMLFFGKEFAQHWDRILYVGYAGGALGVITGMGSWHERKH